MRERLELIGDTGTSLRITPAYAGKTVKDPFAKPKLFDLIPKFIHFAGQFKSVKSPNPTEKVKDHFTFLV